MTRYNRDTLISFIAFAIIVIISILCYWQPWNGPRPTYLLPSLEEPAPPTEPVVS